VTADIDFFFESRIGSVETHETVALPLCEHVAAVYVDTGGWTLDADPSSPYYDHWVHGDPACRKPRYMETT